MTIHCDTAVFKEEATEDTDNTIDLAPIVASIDELSATTKRRLDDFERRLNRPAILKSDDEDNRSKVSIEAFGQYLKGGERAIDAAVSKEILTTSDGGVLFPPEQTSEFIRNLIEFSPIRAYADVRTAKAKEVVIPKRTGVTNAAWRGEAVASTASQPTFAEQTIGVHEIATHVDLSLWAEEDDVFGVVAEVQQALAEDFGKKEATALVNGSGTGQPRGFMSVAGITEVINGHATTLSADKLIDLLYSLPQLYRNGGVWTMNALTLATVRKLKDSQGNYLWQPGLTAGQPETILGRPVVEMIDMPNVASGTTPIAFGDFKAGFRIYDRIELQVHRDELTVRTSGLIRYHARRRVGADVVRPDAFRKLKMSAS